MSQRTLSADTHTRTERNFRQRHIRATSWEWQTATGVFQTDVTNEQLQGLEATGLELVESEPTTVSGRVWTSATVTNTRRRTNPVTPARDQTVLKRILRRLSG